jgi:hypothetical protein
MRNEDRCPQSPVRVRNITGTVHSVTIATPTYSGSLRIEFVESMQRLQRACDRLGVRLQWLRVTGMLVHHARDLLTAQFLQGRGDVLCFIDDDEGFPVRAVFDVVRLAQRLDVVACAVPSKSIDWAAVHRAAARIPEQHAAALLPMMASGERMVATMRDGDGIPLDEPFEVAQAGTGFLAIHRRAFDRIAADAPAADVYEVMPGYRMPTMFHPFIVDSRAIGEDLAFCRRWRQVGGKLWAIAAHNLEHVGHYQFADCAYLRAAVGVSLGTMPRPGESR